MVREFVVVMESDGVYRLSDALQSVFHGSGLRIEQRLKHRIGFMSNSGYNAALVAVREQHTANAQSLSILWMRHEARGLAKGGKPKSLEKV
ncbi:hypothetical protein [Oceanidesulfovibrio marinus]|uniref:Uncharacterized protein n=1 Tax=Oceanidesulfovibrio marinus TaxID=370038 RepID=A0A6P1ZHE8_9BACT|nr:hypothetical protein [Oceanidesulfovibrio marinus]QJT08505.1 hypothetical protein E8L03_06005 [Oceanidesulfovibrio marinus]TVM33027.1 hypothetical protein DQK91_12745 [Oceanidesulfovibrio marinus]